MACCKCASKNQSCVNCICVRNETYCTDCKKGADCNNRPKVPKVNQNSKVVNTPITENGASEYNNEFVNKGLENIQDVEKDGNCFFRCLSLHLHGTEENHRKVREEIVQTLREHKIFLRIIYLSTPDMMSIWKPCKRTGNGLRMSKC